MIEEEYLIFGSARHYDIIDFVSEYFKCSNVEACKILIRDFGLKYEENTKVDMKYIEEKKKEKERKKEVERFYNEIYIRLCEKLHRIRDIIDSFKGKKVLKKVYNKVIRDYKEIDKIIDNIIYANADEKEMIYELKDFFISKI